MKVAVNSLEDFFEEVKFVSEDGDKPLVRCMIHVDQENDGDGFPVYLFASYVSDDGLVCEMQLRCGWDINDRYADGTEKAKLLRSELKEACKGIGVVVRPGRYDLE
jgi:hypothetical protein